MDKAGRGASKANGLCMLSTAFEAALHQWSSISNALSSHSLILIAASASSQAIALWIQLSFFTSPFTELPKRVRELLDAQVSSPPERGGRGGEVIIAWPANIPAARTLQRRSMPHQLSGV